MHWLHLFLVLSLVVHGTAEESRANRSGTDINPSDVSDDMVPSSDESLRRLVESLLEKIERQDTKLQLLDVMVRDNVEDLKRKEIRIGQLERELRSVSKQSQDLTDKRQAEFPDLVANQNRLRQKPNSDSDITIPRQIAKGKREEAQPQRSVRVAPNGAGAFSVSLSRRDLNLHPGLVIVFDKVLLDVDGNYHQGDGVYTVPVSGVYVFTWSTTGTTTDNVITELVVNGSPLGTIFSDAETGHAWDSATGVIVTSVSVGDHVFIRSKFSGIIHSSGIYGKAMFSGWRLS